MRRSWFLLFLPLTSTLCATSLNEGLQKVESYLIVKENKKAALFAKNLSEENPTSAQAHLSYIKALCQGGEEGLALEVWKAHKELLNTPTFEREVLEWISWSILDKAQSSPLMPIVLNALQGASFTNDSKAIPLFLNQLKSPYAIVRAIAVRSCTHFGDDILKEELKRMLKEEKIWYVRLELISAVGQLRMHDCKSLLQEMIGSSKTVAEEQMAAILAIVNMTDHLDENELNCLLTSKRSGMRHLACALIAHFDRWDKIGALLSLLNDHCASVQVAALNALSCASQEVKLSPQDLLQVIKLTQSLIPEVFITAAQTAFLNEDRGAKERLSQQARSRDPDISRLATSAIAASGLKGARLAATLIDSVDDLFAKFNLAWGMIAHRESEKKALDVLLATLDKTEQIPLMWDSSKNPLFNSLSPSNLRHIDQVANYPKIMDQFVRLNILGVLSMRSHPKALLAVRDFLKKSDWGIVAEASALLVQEGEEAQIAEVKQLLNDKDEHVRLQAALVLAFVSSDTQGIPVLMEVFPKMEREQKIHILFALGHIGDARSMPFFLQVMQEPYQQLRVLAASCLIQTLYH